MRVLERFTLPTILVPLAVVLVLSIYLEITYHSFLSLLGGIAVVVALSVLFLRDYHQRPLEVLAPVVVSTKSGDGLAAGTVAEPVMIDPSEEFTDPVIEADRIASGEVLPYVVEDDEAEPGSAPPSA